MNTKYTHESALELLRKYNKEPFHILHGLTVEGCMRWYAKESVSYTHLTLPTIA